MSPATKVLSTNSLTTCQVNICWLIHWQLSLLRKLWEINIYRYAESYCRVSNFYWCTHTITSCLQCRDTFWIELFNHQLLMYLPKHIHFGSPTFNVRKNLAVLDWVRTSHNVIQCLHTLIQNENCQRASTSERLVQDKRRPDRHTLRRVLVDKTCL